MKTLVIRPGALGDTILTLPFLTTLTSLDPHGSLTFLGTRSYLSLIPRYVRTQALDDLKSTWLFCESPRTLIIPELAFDKAYVILHSSDPVARNLKCAGTKTVRIVSPKPVENQHIVPLLHHNADLPVPDPQPLLRHLAPPEKASLVWIHPGSGSPHKCAPLGNFVTLSRFLRKHYRLDAVVTATDQDIFLTREPEWKALLEEQGTRLMKNRPLTELCHQLGGAALFIGNDSGMAHLAASLGVKCLLFFCSTDPLQWAPYVPSQQIHIVDCRETPPHIQALWNVVPEMLDV